MEKTLKSLKQTFESSAFFTPQFKKWYLLFRREFTKYLKGLGATNIVFNRMHFGVFGFFTMPNKQIWYFNIGDVRWNKNEMLIRTAKNYKDYSGGSNQSARVDTFSNFKSDMERIIK